MNTSDGGEPDRKDRERQYSLRTLIKFIVLFSVPWAVVANLPRELRDFVVERLIDPKSVLFGIFVFLFITLPLLPVLLRPDFGTRKRRRWFEPRRHWHDRDDDDGTLP